MLVWSDPAAVVGLAVSRSVLPLEPAETIRLYGSSRAGPRQLSVRLEFLWTNKRLRLLAEGDRFWKKREFS